MAAQYCSTGTFLPELALLRSLAERSNAHLAAESPRPPPAHCSVGAFCMTRRLAVKTAATAAAIFQALPNSSIVATACYATVSVHSLSDFDNYGVETSGVFCVAATRQHWEDAAITPRALDKCAGTCDAPDYLSEMVSAAGFMRF